MSAHLRTLLRACLAALCLLAGCAGTPSSPLAPVASLFDDSRFSQVSTVPDSAAVFGLSPAMRAYLDKPAFRAQLKKLGKERGLVAALYAAGELKLEYDIASTRTAAEAFDVRRGNCLSLVIMTAAFAKALELDVRYQNVEVANSWRRDSELLVASGHVNLSLGGSLSADRAAGSGRFLTIDFLPAEDVAGYHSFELAEATIVAMFLNNRAVEALLRQDIDQAYWLARAAVRQDPAFVAGYNTLAVIYQRHGDAALAERSWRVALAREPENVVVMRNLAPLLASTGRAAEGEQLTRRAAAIEPYPPFHFFRLGMTAMENKDYAAARAWFGREVKRAPYNDEFHFWLGMALLRLGEPEAARAQLALALRTSSSADSGRLYSAKLEQMRNGAGRQ